MNSLNRFKVKKLRTGWAIIDTNSFGYVEWKLSKDCAENKCTVFNEVYGRLKNTTPKNSCIDTP